MSSWRALRGWTPSELRAQLARLEHAERSFDPREVEADPRWRAERAEAVVARERPGPPGETFARLREAVASYRFSDARIVEGHFDSEAPLLGRRMLLELKPMGLRFLSGVAVTEVIDREGDRESAFGFRYDTLEGHVERGWEWFLLTKHASGEISFCVRSRWRSGEFPNWWSRAGFALLNRHYRMRWLRAAEERLAIIARGAPSTRHRSLRTEGARA